MEPRFNSTTSLSSSSSPSISLITDCGEGHSSCGYCKSDADTSCSYGMQADCLTVDAYQQLLDRGWRRSGRWIYRPVHKETCCQLLTIRLDVYKFSPNKEQKKVQLKWDAYLAGELDIKKHNTSSSDASLLPSGSSPKRPRDETMMMDDYNDDIINTRMIDMATTTTTSSGVIKKRDSYHDSIIMDDDGNTIATNTNDTDNAHNAALFGGGKRQRSMVDLQEYETTNMNTSHSDHQYINNPLHHNHHHLIPVLPISTHNDNNTDIDDGASPTAALSERLQSTLGSPLRHTTTISTTNNNNNDDDDATVQQVLQECIYNAIQQCFVGDDEIELNDAVQAMYNTPTAISVLHITSEKQRKKWTTTTDSSNDSNNNTNTANNHAVLMYSSPIAMAIAGKLNKNSKRKKDPSHDSNNNNTNHLIVKPQDIAQRLVNIIKSSSTIISLPSTIVDVIALSGHLNFYSTTNNNNNTGSDNNNNNSNNNNTTTTINKSSTSLITIPRSVPRHFELIMKPSSDSSLPTIEFDLYKRYQVMHHGDEPSAVSLSSFRRFLCDSPLIPSSSPSEEYPGGGVPSCGFGSFHQQYFIDGRLVAVGVVDVLPKCLSSKYLFWDPDLAPLSLGKVTSLQEIEWIKQANQQCSTLKYYYLGYYIHTCHRMKYKADFAPSDLLCPVNQCWVPIERVRGLLESGVKEPALSTVPGALLSSLNNSGSGDNSGTTTINTNNNNYYKEYCVTEDGRPANPPRQPTVDEVGDVLLFISMPSSTQSSSRSGRGGRRGQIVSFDTLCTLGILREGAEERIRRRLEKWMYVVGPVWRQLVYCIN